MKSIFVYPGCFTPPTYGHYRIVARAAELFPEITIICSTNDAKAKTRWFSEEECREMWDHYAVPENVRVETFSSFMKKKIDNSRIVMIRGVRDEKDLADEARVMELNKKMFSIDKYFYILAEENFADISATKTRRAAEELDFPALAKYAHPLIVTRLLEKVISAKNVFMVAGKSGSGKSTFLRMIAAAGAQNVVIDTDSLSQKTKALIFEKFGPTVNLAELAISRNEELEALIADKWFALLKEAMQKVPAGSNVFLEIPYGLRPQKQMFRYVGGKILYVGCDNIQDNIKRVIARGTPKHAQFVYHIPGLEESRKIAEEEGLLFHAIDSSGSLKKTEIAAISFAKKLETGEIVFEKSA